MNQHARANQQVEAATQPDSWRFLNATFGWCAACHVPFQTGEVIVWHVRTRETHPTCCKRKHPHLKNWIDSAPGWRRKRRC